ncbi:MAG TPA: RcnB family protein [Allosphingosinicella sp.]|nr:RcnB family protein [Allosphingosinicella sp.]
MRKALIGLLIATTAASPLAAQDNGWHGRGDGEHHQRAEGQQRPQRQERQQAQQQPQPQAQRQGGWQGRQQVQAQPQVQVQVQQQQVQTRGYRQGYQGQQATRGGYTQQQDAYRQQIEASRAANRQVSQGMPERYQRRAAENEANYERQLTQQRYGREGQRSGYSGYQGRQGYDRQNYQGGYNREGSRSRVQWNRTWRNDNRYDWQRYRYSNRDIFRSPYYAPRGYGYGYNRLSIGGLLDQIFWGQNYWIADPYEYRLPAAPYGTQWVRYYNDVVLVDVYSGEVIDVIYDFFW